MPQKYDITKRGLLLTDYQGNKHIGKHMQMSEQVSEPFLMTCTLLSDNFHAQDQLGQNISCTWYELTGERQKEKRSFNGHIVAINQLDRFDKFDNLSKFEISVRPWLWLLQFSQKNRIFQQTNLSGILKTVFDDAGFAGKYKLNNLPSAKRPFTVQYNETDLEFIHRLLSEQGINYFFEHKKGSHTLCFHKADLPFTKGPVNKVGLRSSAQGKMPTLLNWQNDWSAHSNAVQLSAYDYGKSTATAGGKKKTSSHKIAHASRLIMDRYPVDTVDGKFSDLGDDLANTELARIESGYRRISAESHIDDMVLATCFSLDSHPDPKQKGDYAIVSITHTIDASEQSARYENHFECMPKNDSFLPPFYPKPRIYGLQTAEVAGKKQGERQHDDQGRIKIRFHWDKEKGDNPSCYVRVAQGMTGKGAGMQFIPRVGEEVLVSYINNDPDQPIVVGSVYNSAHKPPYAEANSTKTGIKTQPSATSNELHFDDKKDKEQIYLNAAKDLVTNVENDTKVTVKGAATKSVTKAITISTDDNYSLTVKKTLSEKAENIILEAEKKITLKVGGNSIELSGSGISIDGKKLDIKTKGDTAIAAGNVKSAAKANTTITSGANLKCSAKAKSTLEGIAGVKVDSKAQVKISGMAGVDVKSPVKVSVSAAALAELKGGITKIG